MEPPPGWCHVCTLDLQSAKSLSQHQQGRKHRKKAGLPVLQRPQAAALTADELFEGLSRGRYTRVVVCTGAGVSTSAGIRDFRSAGGMFDAIRRRWADRFVELRSAPEKLLSKRFADHHPVVWAAEVVPWLGQLHADSTAEPTAAHRLCGELYRRGWLMRVYTQNIDGLHTHPSAGLPPHTVVECHGSLRDSSVVRYGDALPASMTAQISKDFSEPGPDLLLVMGTSLQVAPFCAIPNLAPSNCARVLVNRDLEHSLTNSWSIKQKSHRASVEAGSLGLGGTSCTALSSVKLAGQNVSLRPSWEGSRWSQLLIERDCDEFAEQVYECLNEESGAPCESQQ